MRGREVLLAAAFAAAAAILVKQQKSGFRRFENAIFSLPIHKRALIACIIIRGKKWQKKKSKK